MSRGAIRATLLALSLPLIGLAALVLANLLTSIAPQGSDAPKPELVPIRDRLAYESLRAKGFSHQDAKIMAPEVRELCYAAGGEICE